MTNMTEKHSAMAQGYLDMAKINLSIENEFMNSDGEQQVINKIKGVGSNDARK
jgi:hypothetical protein